MSVQETVLYQDPRVLITNARAVIGGSTYAIANVTSVSNLLLPANRVRGIIVAAVGVLLTDTVGELRFGA